MTARRRQTKAALESDFQVTIPEIGTRKALHIPFVFLTSNNYRDISDALRRRCIHLYIDYPPPRLEMEIVRMKLPGIEERLVRKIVSAVGRIRQLDLKKRPCISETIDWAHSLMILQATDLSASLLQESLNVVCKHRSDLETVRKAADHIVSNDGTP